MIPASKRWRRDTCDNAARGLIKKMGLCGNKSSEDSSRLLTDRGRTQTAHQGSLHGAFASPNCSQLLLPTALIHLLPSQQLELLPNHCWFIWRHSCRRTTDFVHLLGWFIMQIRPDNHRRSMTERPCCLPIVSLAHNHFCGRLLMFEKQLYTHTVQLKKHI